MKKSPKARRGIQKILEIAKNEVEDGFIWCGRSEGVFCEVEVSYKKDQKLHTLQQVEFTHEKQYFENKFAESQYLKESNKWPKAIVEVSQLKSLIEKGQETNFIVKGSLTDIITTDTNEVFTSKDLGVKIIGNVRSGLLEDESGRIKVKINPNSMIDAELLKEAYHFISCQKTENGVELVVQLSTH